MFDQQGVRLGEGFTARNKFISRNSGYRHIPRRAEKHGIAVLPGWLPCHVHKYLGFLVTDPADMLRRNHDLLAGIPMAGLHNQVTNRPTLVVDDKINDVADRSFAGLDGVAAKSLCALQMNIVACLLTGHKMRRRRSLGKTADAPRFDSVPVCLIL